MRPLRHPLRPVLAALALIVRLASPGGMAAQQASTALDLAAMDCSVKPGDNFFAYVNGTWLRQTEIPADRSSYGAFVNMAELRVRDAST